jgi:hypothetical protein
MPCDAQELLNAAVAGGFDNLSDHTLKVAIAEMVCQSRGVIPSQGTNPTDPPANPAVASLVLQTATNKLWAWNPVTETWFSVN